jgi:hypothetical protein
MTELAIVWRLSYPAIARFDPANPENLYSPNRMMATGNRQSPNSRSISRSVVRQSVL